MSPRGRPETAVRLAIRNALDHAGFAVWDMEQNRKTRQTPGFPDLVALGHGRITFIECKAPGGKMSPAQLVFRDACTANGGEHYCWDTVESAINWLRGLGIVE